ncbi:Por secretion system C-terminal sorting domain-containing protein [Chryseobacterium oleae]|uniref:Por secretion system C-terminal sorting domain-containing protein n=1 Tax=Chryseobacterium oleae TaxID=491207 RepID=A0A1I4W1C0_CHROL|nr:T9SS-dependent M36 family metallopeptidase [Chryseobacterium oleae]SFN07374.1 Por secretion system C-terminal sorting domain-containing protein [Chryseobacterium oleae]
MNKKLQKLLVAVASCGFALSLAQNHEETIKKYLNDDRSLRSMANELKDFEILNVDPSASLKGDVVVVQQKINGVPVYNKISTLLIKDNKITYSSMGFADHLKSSGVPDGRPGLSPEKAFQSFAETSKLKTPEIYRFGSADKKESSEDTPPVHSKLFYFLSEDQMHLAYQFVFDEAETSNMMEVIVDAHTAKVLHIENKTISETFHDDLFKSHDDAEYGQKTVAYPMLPKKQNLVLAPPSNASYNVFALPVEAPSFGSRSIVSNPWDLTASPQGWHSNGTTSYTTSRGNNVYAYTDTNNTNTVGAVANGGSTRNFDFPLDVNQVPTTYTSAAITNLFYTNNMMHDIFYKYGFTESARNFQVSNFGKGGSGNDAVLAEARDGSTAAKPSFNNANFSSPADGSAPRMQMYLFDPKVINSGFSISAPSDLTTLKPNVRYAREGMGPQLSVTGMSGDLKVASPLDGCTALTNTNLSGKIALIERGTCDLAVKVKNAQTAGAKAVVFYNIPASAFGSFGAPDASVNIPSVLVQNGDGVTLKNKLDQNVNVNITLKRDPSTFVYLDASLDNGIIAHEYGHGISNRLTGTGSSCLSFPTDNEQMGEGWADFFALMLTMKPTDNATIPRGMGTFASGQETAGGGIRPAKYSPDFSINNYTYGKTNGMKVNSSDVFKNPITVANVHSIGFVWATMLWDLHWKYVEKYGFNNDMSNTSSGSSKALQLVMDALKLQPCNPTFVQGRNAILAADLAKTGGADKCMIWKTFAKRGLGVNAKSGKLNGYWSGADQPAPDLNDQVEDFTVPAECNTTAKSTLTEDGIKSKNNVSIYPNPAKNEIFIEANAKGSGFVKIYDVSGKLVKEDKVSLSEKSRVNISDLADGVYVVKVDGLGIDRTEKIIVRK